MLTAIRHALASAVSDTAADDCTGMPYPSRYFL